MFSCIRNANFTPILQCLFLEMFVVVCGTLPPRPVLPNTTGSGGGGIYLGEHTSSWKFPWHASMYYDELDEPKKYFCGASIIQENLLITAAHCVFDENTRQLVDPSKIYILTGNLFRKYDYPFHEPLIVKSNQVCIYI